MIDVITEVISSILVAVVVGVVSIGVAALKNGVKSAKVSDALGRLERAAIATTYQLQADTVDYLKARSKNGKLTRENIGMLQDLARDRTLATLDDPAQELLRSVGADVELLIRGFVERTVKEIRASE